MNLSDNEKHILYSLAGGLNFIGGSFTPEKLAEMKFEEVLRCCINNGISISFKVEKSIKAKYLGTPNDIEL